MNENMQASTAVAIGLGVAGVGVAGYIGYQMLKGQSQAGRQPQQPAPYNPQQANLAGQSQQYPNPYAAPPSYPVAPTNTDHTLQDVKAGLEVARVGVGLAKELAADIQELFTSDDYTDDYSGFSDDYSY